ncbi:MAG: hypothetical protein U5M51_13525 [Emticicia sp.]|nr:hypothetical protein [Emticicia sp.]
MANFHSIDRVLGLTQNLKNWWLSGAEAPILGVSAASAVRFAQRPKIIISDSITIFA